MAFLHKYKGHYDMSLTLHSEVLLLKKQIYGEDSPSVLATCEMIDKIRRIDDIRKEAEESLSTYATQRQNEIESGVGVSKDSKIDAAYFLLQYIKDHGVESFNNLSKIVGYHRHKTAIENGRLHKIVLSIRSKAFTDFK